MVLLRAPRLIVFSSFSVHFAWRADASTLVVTATACVLLTFHTALLTQFSPGLQIRLCQTKHLHFHRHLQLSTFKTNSSPDFSKSEWRHCPLGGLGQTPPFPHRPLQLIRKPCAFYFQSPLSLFSTGAGLGPSSLLIEIIPTVFKMVFLLLNVASLHLILLSATRVTCSTMQF